MRLQFSMWRRAAAVATLLLAATLSGTIPSSVSVQRVQASRAQTPEDQAQSPNPTLGTAPVSTLPKPPPRTPGPFLRNGGPAPRGLPGVPPLVSRPDDMRVSRGASAEDFSDGNLDAFGKAAKRDRTAIAVSGNFIYVVQDNVLYQLATSDLRVVRQVRLQPLLGNVPGGNPQR
jgi:hypothetical protein